MQALCLFAHHNYPNQPRSGLHCSHVVTRVVHLDSSRSVETHVYRCLKRFIAR